MSIKVQRISGTILDGATTVNLSSPTHFEAVSALSKAFIMSAMSVPITVGQGYTTSNNRRDLYCTADLTAINTITIQRSGNSGETQFAFWLVEFTGIAGDEDEFVMRGKTSTNVANNVASANSAAISGIVSASKTIPFATVRSGSGAGSGTVAANVMIDVSMAVDSGNNVNAILRPSVGTAEAIDVIVYNVEWIHANTSVQTGVETTTILSNQNRDVTISSVTNINQAFVYSHFFHVNDPDDLTFYAWLTSTTNLRLRARTANAPDRRFRWWVIRNPTFGVQHVSAVDGTNDILDADSTEDFTITSVDTTRSLIVGHAGSDSTSSLNGHPSAIWAFQFLNSTTVRAIRRRSVGGSEYTFSVVQFAAASALPSIVAVSTIVPAQQFVISGVNFGATQGSVTINSVAQTVLSWSATDVTCLAVQGNNPFLLLRNLVLTTAASQSATPRPVALTVPNNEGLRVLETADAPTDWRFVTSPDMAAGDHIHIRNAQGTATTNVLVLGDATWLCTDEDLTQFEARAWDPGDQTWGSWGIQTVIVSEPTEPPVTPPPPHPPKALFCPDIASISNITGE